MNQIENPVLSNILRRFLAPGGTGGAGFVSLFISNLVTIFLIVAAVVAFFFLVMGGIQWIMSGGDKTATEEARGRITAAITGLILVFAAWAIIVLVQTFLGITILGGPINLPTL